MINITETNSTRSVYSKNSVKSQNNYNAILNNQTDSFKNSKQVQNVSFKGSIGTFLTKVFHKNNPYRLRLLELKAEAKKLNVPTFSYHANDKSISKLADCLKLQKLKNEVLSLGQKVKKDDNYNTLLNKIKLERELKPEAKVLGVEIKNNDTYYDLFNRIDLETNLKPKAKELGIEVTENDSAFSLYQKIKLESELKPKAKELGIEIESNETCYGLEEKINYKILSTEVEKQGLAVDIEDNSDSLRAKLKAIENDGLTPERREELRLYEEEQRAIASLYYYN